MSREALRKLRYDFEQKVARRMNEVRTHIFADRAPVTDLAAFETMAHITPAAAARSRFKPVRPGWEWGRAWSTSPCGTGPSPSITSPSRS
ncbi:MAG: hypothetical protein ABIF71_09690 [Planctomycetota bacterium]